LLTQSNRKAFTYANIFELFFYSFCVREIIKLKPVMKAYINEAIELEAADVKVKLKKISEFAIREEFQNK